MNNVEFIKEVSPSTGEEIEYAIIDRGNNEFTAMPKSVYDKMIAAQTIDQPVEETKSTKKSKK